MARAGPKTASDAMLPAAPDNTVCHGKGWRAIIHVKQAATTPLPSGEGQG